MIRSKGPEAEEFMTFMGWVKKDRGVKKGEKAVAFVDLTINGETAAHGLFAKSQTIKLVRVYRDPQEDWDQYWKRDGFLGYDDPRLSGTQQ